MDAIFSPFDRMQSDNIAFHVRALLSYLPLTVQSLTCKCALIFEPQLDVSVVITLDTYPTSFDAEDAEFPSPFSGLDADMLLSRDAVAIDAASAATTHSID